MAIASGFKRRDSNPTIKTLKRRENDQSLTVMYKRPIMRRLNNWRRQLFNQLILNRDTVLNEPRVLAVVGQDKEGLAIRRKRHTFGVVQPSASTLVAPV